MNHKKVILHLCASEYGSDTRDYRAHPEEYEVISITKEIGIENYHPPANVYGIFANPPCTKFSRAAWQIKKKDRDFKEGMRLVRECLRIIWEVQEQGGANLAWWALENPTGYLRQFLGHPHFSYQAWQFGETNFLATKRTDLWGYFNAPKPLVAHRTVLPVQKRKTYKQSLFPGVTSKTTTEWSNLTKNKSSDARSVASPYFTNSFFNANR